MVTWYLKIVAGMAITAGLLYLGDLVVSGL